MLWPYKNGEAMDVQEKVTQLRSLMQSLQMDAWIVPSSDPHQSEYPADCWKARQWISGFTGSAGTVVITQDKAGLWVDPRYHIRAEQELKGSGIEPFKMGLPGMPSYTEWLRQELKDHSVIGFDGNVFSAAEVASLRSAFQDKSILFSYQYDLVGQLWKEKPERPANPVTLYDIEFAGETRQSKIERIRQIICEQKAGAHLVSTLDDIAWTLNMRGSDVEYNPVAISYLVITDQEARLFIAPEEISQEVRHTLENEGVAFSGYEDIYAYLQQLPQQTTVLIDPEKTSYRLERLISQTCLVKEAPCIPFLLKAVKNEIELDGMRKAYLRDGVAVVRWMHWLDQQALQTPQTEITLASQLAEFRKLGDHFQGLSFATICGYKANSAVGHYTSHPETTPVIKPVGILLVDSGAQYLDGTTDLTRTLTLGAPTSQEKQAFTVVLKCHIRLARAIFPKGTRGNRLDALAREYLWLEGWNCRHGIGHGIGHFLNVHEGPQRFSPENAIEIEPGMVLIQ